MSLISGLTGEPVQQVDYQRDHGFGEMLWGGFKQENTLVSLANWYAKSRNVTSDKNFQFDPFEDLDGYEEDMFQFIRSQNKWDVARTKERIDGERKTREMLHNGGAKGLAAMMIAGVLDPMILMPAGQALRGGSLLRQVGTSARVGLVGMGVTEGVLQATQSQRTGAETGFAVAGGALFAGILGPIHIKGVKKAKREKVIAQIEEDLRIPEPGEVDRWGFNQARVSEGDIKQATGFRGVKVREKISPDDVEPESGLTTTGGRELVPEEGAGGGGGGGGDVVRPEDLLDGEGSKPIPWTKKGPSRIEEQIKSTYGVGEKIAFLTPGMRLAMKSRSTPSRRLFQALAESPLYYEKNILEKGGETTQAAETFIKLENTVLGNNVIALDNAYYKYRTGMEAPGVFKTRLKLMELQARDVASNARDVLPDAVRRKKLTNDDLTALAKPGDDYLSKRQFHEAVSYALDHPNMHIGIPDVEDLAKVIREDFFDRYGNRMVDAGMLKKSELRSNFLTRVYNREAIGARRDEFAIVIREWMVGRHPEMSEIEITRAVEETIDTIMGVPQGHIMVPRANTLKSRVIDIENDFISADGIRLADFLERDIATMMHMYHRSVVPELVLTETFGDPTLKPHIKVIRDWYHATRRDVLDVNKKRKTETPGQYNDRVEGIRTQIQKEMENDIRDIEGIRDILLGTYRASDGTDGLVRTGKFIRRVNVTRHGGGFMVSSVPDLARPVMVHGYERTYREGIDVFVNNREVFNQLSKEVAGYGGIGAEMTLATRGKSLADIGDPYGRMSMPERVAEGMSNTFFLINMLGPWNHAMKHFSGVVSSSRIMDAAETLAGGGKLDLDTLEHMNSLGLPPERLKAIWGQFEAHGELIDGHKLPKADDWADQLAARNLRSAVVKDVDNIIVTPGAGDRPLAMNTEIGRIVGQYKGFAFASTTKMLLSSLQRKDMAVMNGIALSGALGMGVYMMKERARGKEIDFSPGKLAWEGVDRSGLIGIISDFNNMIEVATRGQVGVHKLLGGGISSRYSQRGAAGGILGPSVGLIEDFYKATGALSTGDLRKSDIRSVRRLIPYQNLFYIRGLFDAAERGAGAVLGAEGR